MADARGAGEVEGEDPRDWGVLSACGNFRGEKLELVCAAGKEPYFRRVALPRKLAGKLKAEARARAGDDDYTFHGKNCSAGLAPLARSASGFL